MLRVEVLYPEVCNLFGNTYNIKYLEQSVEDIEIINTSLNDEPTFVKEDIDLVYMAPMTEKTQELVIEKLKPHTETIKKQIQENKAFFMIGNALEVVYNTEKIKMVARFNDLVLQNFMQKET